MKNFFKVQRKFKGGFKVGTLKVKSISVMLIFTMMMAVFMPITASARTVLPVDETGDMHIWTTTDGNLHWDGVSEATGYTVTVYPHPGNSAIFTDHISWEYWAYGLYSELDEREFDNGDYRIEVSADGTSKSQTAVIYYDSPYEKLAVPTGLSWSGDMATWNNVPNATSYDVYLTKTTIGSSSVVGAVTGTSVDLSGYSLENGWYFEVVAKADGYRSSELAESPRYGGGTNTIIPVDETGNMHIWTTTDGNLHWDGVSEATGYTVTVYPHPGNSAIFTDHISWEYWAYGLYSELDEREFDNGDYRIEVSADGTSKSQTAVIYYDSPYEKLAVPTGLSWSGDMATWNNVPNATSYDVYLTKTTIGSSSVVGAVTGTSVDLSGYSLENGWYFEVVAKADGYRSSELAESPRYSGGSTTYTCSFNSNGGTGTMADVTGLTGTYTLPANEFIAPANKQFKGWSLTSDGAIITSVEMTTDRTIYAIWEDIPATLINELSATVTAPVGGEHPSFTVTVPDGAHYTATVYAWYDFDAGIEMTALDTFVAGTQYQVRIHFTANTGYEIADSASYTINGTPNNAAFDTAKQRGMIFVATAPAVTTYTVTYDANGGTGTMADVTGISGEYTLLANGFTAPDGKQFKAWSVGGDEKAVGDKITVTANTTVTAIWEAIEYNVTVTGGTASVGAGAPITKATMGTTVTLTAGAAPTGQMFDKWVVNGVVVDDANSATTTFVMPAGNVTATATYKDIPVVTYTVTFDSNGGSAVTAQTIEEGQKATKPADPTKSGYDFKGWTLNGSAYDFNSAVNGDITLVATWEQQQVVPTVYTVTFDSNGGSAVTAQTIEEGQKATKPADPTKSGYDFKGWTLNGSAYDFNTAVNGDITLVATWETIPAGHTCDIKPVAKVEPSCTEGGKEAYYKCEGCGKFYEDALGVKEITDLAAWGNIAKNGHTESDWKSDKDNHWKECTVAACGVIIENSRAAHADANNDGKCDTCEYNVGTTTTNPGNKPNDNPQTGDNSNMFLWIALLFVSGFGVVATTVIGKKKSSAK